MIKQPVIILIVILFIGNPLVYSQVKPAPLGLHGLTVVRDITVSTDGKEAYSTVQSPANDISVIVSMTKLDDGWTLPEIASFSGEHIDLEPFLSPDNLRLYFSSSRPKATDSVAVSDFDIWLVSRENINSEWGEPVNVGSPVNSATNEFYPAVTREGTIYFTCDCEGAKGKDDIFYSAMTDGVYSSPVSLGEAINSEGYEFNAYISPDDDLLIFSGYARPDGSGGGDLYYSIKDQDDNWMPAVNLGTEINSKYLDFCPYYHVNSGTLFFTSRRSNISTYGPFGKMDDLIQTLNTYDNGQSKLYKLKWKPGQ